MYRVRAQFYIFFYQKRIRPRPLFSNISKILQSQILQVETNALTANNKKNRFIYNIKFEKILYSPVLIYSGKKK